MADPTTTNRGFAVPTRGSDVGTWDTPLNTNFGALDNNLGGVSTIALTNAPVTLTSAQYQCGTIRLTGALTASVTITFPAVSGWWLVDNQTTGAFVALLTCGSGRNIATEQGVATDIFTDGSNVAFRDLGKIGGYWDYSGSTVPLWVQACSVPPFLNCDGSTYSAATYPYLNGILGTTTLPDLRGVTRANLNQGTGRITTAGSNIDGDTRFSIGGAQTSTLLAANLPSHTHSGTTGNDSPDHTHSYTTFNGPTVGGGGSFGPVSAVIGLSTGGASTRHQHPFTTDGGAGLTGTPIAIMPPVTIAGITMIRAA